MKMQYTYWQDNDGNFLGYLNEYPDHWLTDGHIFFGAMRTFLVQ